jgi:hypothetical protein
MRGADTVYTIRSHEGEKAGPVGRAESADGVVAIVRACLDNDPSYRVVSIETNDPTGVVTTVSTAQDGFESILRLKLAGKTFFDIHMRSEDSSKSPVTLAVSW